MATAVVSEPPRPQGRNVVFGRDALESGHHHDTPGGQLAVHPPAVDAADAGASEAGVGMDARLRPAQADGLVAQVSEGHQEGAGNQLAR